MAGSAGVGRFGPSYEWDRLLTDPAVQDAYTRDLLTWDGKFASEGLGITGCGLTCDHVDLEEDGTPKKGARYTAASKESLHVEMLAKVVDRSPLAWHWIAGASDESEAVGTAVQRLTDIIGAYEAFAQEYPGLGGFLPWLTVSDSGLLLDLGKPQENIMIPALDNGQLAWALLAAATALEGQEGQGLLAQRYRSFVEQTMAPAVNALFLRPDGKPGSIATVKDPRAPASAENRELSGTEGYPFEGELMVVFMDLYGTWEDPSKRQQLWLDIRFHTRQTKEFADPGLPSGPITVQEGWRFSAHEMWKYMVLPYFDHALARRIFLNGERARTWNSHLKQLPGLLASTYDARHKYHDTFGIHSLSKGYDEPPSEDLMVTPYGAYPVILADRGCGLAWHRTMVSRPRMQCVLGSVEAVEALRTPPQVARKTSWDTKVTTDLAAIGGVVDLLRRSLKQSGKYERFQWIMDFNYNAWNGIPLRGEDAGFAPPPEDRPDEVEDFPTCQRLEARQPAILL